jgi:hypothetical protein
MPRTLWVRESCVVRSGEGSGPKPECNCSSMSIVDCADPRYGARRDPTDSDFPSLMAFASL